MNIFLAATTSLAMAAAVVAQDLPGISRVPFDRTISDSAIDLPMPPRGAADRLVKHGRITVPDGGPGLPEPIVPETRLDGHAPMGGVPAHDLTANPTPLPPSGNASTSAPEPTVCSPDSMDTLFTTANWFAAYSTNGGTSWTAINPYTRFPSVAGGFCCDQWAITKNNATFWFLQYDTTATATNAVRIAVAANIAALRSGSFFPGVVIRADQLGYTASDWLDFPDLAATDTYLYATSNVFTVSNSSYRGAVVWRMPLAELISGVPVVTIQYYTDINPIRLTHGATNTMWCGTPSTSSAIRVFSWADNSATRTAPTTQTISSYAIPSGTTTNAGPDGRGWTGKADSRFMGGFYSPGRFREGPRFGFYWMSDPTGSYPKVHIRGAIFDATIGALVEQPVIWNSNYATGYPAVAANGFGHRGVAFAFGGGTLYPGVAMQVDDDLGTESLTLLSGNMGPGTNRFGDYFSVQSGGGFSTHPEFLCSTAARNSSGTMLTWPRRVFRRAFTDGFVGIAVTSFPRSVAANVAMSPADSFGSGGGTTPFYRAVPKATGNYTFTAPSTTTGPNNRRWAFVRWHRLFAPGQSYQAQTQGQRAYSVTTGNATFPTSLVAEYTPLYDIDLSANVPVTVTVSPADFGGLTTPSLPKVVQYVQSASVTITAPLTTPNLDRFVRWTLNDIPQPDGQLAVTIGSVIDDQRLVATYRRFTPSAIGNVGSGCAGSNGTPAHNVTSAAAGGVQIGATNDYAVTNARANSIAVLTLGVSNTSWLGIPLPLNLTAYGAPTCFVRNDLAVTISTGTSATGTATVPVACPNDVNLIGGTHYTSFACFDPPANQLGLVLSNTRSIRLGGLQ